MESIHDVPLSEDFAEFQHTVNSKGEWFCDHGVNYKDDCAKCDEEWGKIEDEWGPWGSLGYKDEKIVDAEIVEDDPVECDHGKPLDKPKLGACQKCDNECGNSKQFGDTAAWRVIKGGKYKHEKDEWVKISAGTGTSYVSSKPLCKHFMQEFTLENGLTIFASADRDVPANWKRDEKDMPDLGVYLYSGWVRDEFYVSPGLEVPWGIPSTWPMAHLDWPDFSVPDDPDDAIIAGQWILEQIAAGKRVETGCLGGHGRTGTMLALLLVLQGVKPGTAIERVRKTYCDEAIEGNKQIDLIVYGYEQAHGKTWKQSKNERKRVEDARPAPSKPKITPVGTTPTTAIEKHYGSKCTHGRWMDEPCVACDKLYN